jgi:hypothetical protein
MKKTTILMTILLVVAMVGALALVTQNQETRRGAAFANTTLSVLPSEKITKAVGDVLSAQVWFQTESGAKVDGVQTIVCYGDELSLSETSGATANTEAGFDADPIIVVKDAGDNQSCATIVATSKKSASSLTTTAKALTINFTAVKAGSGNITINKDKSMVTGDNSASATDKIITVTSVAGTTYEITGETVTGDEPILNYKVAYSNVNAGDASCVVNWPLQVIILGGGESKAYSGVIPSTRTEVNGKVVMSGSLALTGFSHFDNLAVFIKGPKHLQMKYAVQNQSAAYSKAGGELTLTKSASTSTVYDFTAYPMIPGDVTGSTDGVQDGWIDGIDFSYVKTRALTHETVSGGEYLKSDLDGNCQVNSNDVNILKISLQTKQGQLY